MRIGLIFLLIVGAAFSQGEDPPFGLPDNVELRLDVVYTRYGAREMRLDIYRPKGNPTPLPAVLYVHGGGWKGGSKNAFRRQAAYLATRGFAGACVEYRLSGEAKWPAAYDDVRAALRYLQDHAKELGIDVARIGAAGGSAGGHLAALLGTMPNPVKAVAAFNPALDLVAAGKNRQSKANSTVEAFLGCPYLEKPQLWADASPVTHVSPQSAAFLFLHGTSDTTVPYPQSVDMMNKLKAAGVHAEIFTAEGAPHAFFNRPPWFEPTLQRMAEFFLQRLR